MKSISLRQPWASCLASTAPSAKRTENRGRPTSHRGLIAIHASLTPDVPATHDLRVVNLLGDDPWEWMPVGAILAVADLVDCHQAYLGHNLETTCCQPWGERHYSGGQPAWHLVLDNVRPIQPVEARGQISVPWTVPDPIADQVRQQLAVTS